MNKYELYIIISSIAILVGVILVIIGPLLAMKHKHAALGLVSLLGGGIIGGAAYWLAWSVDEYKKNKKN